ncbi:hypothetical protein JYU34_020170 [Plutella xylostella]|uniref:Uncharacterized protein n=2 Tax=Plutella xylostella TaxID=51655 RepID=A0ABQ7PW44_PLUXY|nr:hypothetical protein JYU34_020170 [Plutella xylostella]
MHLSRWLIHSQSSRHNVCLYADKLIKRKKMFPYEILLNIIAVVDRFAYNYGVQPFYSRVLYEGERVIYLTCLDAPVGHFLMDPGSMSTDKCITLFTELEITLPDGRSLWMDFDLSPSKLFWWIKWEDRGPIFDEVMM